MSKSFQNKDGFAYSFEQLGPKLGLEVSMYNTIFDKDGKAKNQTPPYQIIQENLCNNI